MSLQLYTVKEAAKILHIKEVQVRTYIKLGILRASKIGGKMWRISDADIQECYNKFSTNNITSLPPVDNAAN